MALVHVGGERAFRHTHAHTHAHFSLRPAAACCREGRRQQEVEPEQGSRHLGRVRMVGSRHSHDSSSSHHEHGHHEHGTSHGASRPMHPRQQRYQERREGNDMF